jgi:hypothetical protein
MTTEILPTLVPVAGFFFILLCCSGSVMRNTWNRVHVLTTRVQRLEEQQLAQQIPTAAPQVVIPIQPQQPQVQPQPYPYHQGIQHPLFQVTYPPTPNPTAPVQTRIV